MVPRSPVTARLLVAPGDIVVETGPTATFDFSPPFLSARATSDGDVPEPATLLLLGAGAGMATWVRRKRAA
jgi:hypothetical protein